MSRRKDSDRPASRLAQVESEIDAILDPRGRPWEEIPIDLLRDRAVTLPGAVSRAYRILASEAERGMAEGGPMPGSARSRSGYIVRLPQGVRWPDIGRLLLKREELRTEAPEPTATATADACTVAGTTIELMADGVPIDIPSAHRRVLVGAILGMLTALETGQARQIVITLKLP